MSVLIFKNIFLIAFVMFQFHTVSVIFWTDISDKRFDISSENICWKFLACSWTLILMCFVKEKLTRTCMFNVLHKSKYYYRTVKNVFIKRARLQNICVCVLSMFPHWMVSEIVLCLFYWRRCNSIWIQRLNFMELCVYVFGTGKPLECCSSFFAS